MFTDARGIHQAAMSTTPILLREVLDEVGISIHDIDHVITHQTSACAIRKGMAKMSEVFGDTPKHDAVITVDRYGNTASTTHTVALIEELEAQHIRPGDTIALIALASGLEIGVVLLSLDEEMVNCYGNVIDRIELTEGGWRDRHSALRLAVRAARAGGNDPTGHRSQPRGPARRLTRHFFVRHHEWLLRRAHCAADRRRLPAVAFDRLCADRRERRQSGSRDE
jgi:hypothetical protein